MKPLAWNTLDEAADWLSKNTGETWSARHVLSAALAYPKENGCSIAYLKAAMPRDTKLAVYEWNPAKGTPEKPFVRKFGAQWEAMRLCLIHVRDLLVHGAATVSIVRYPEDDCGRENEFVFIEPLDQEHLVTLDMVGINADDLVAFLKKLPKEAEHKQQQNNSADMNTKHTTKDMETLNRAATKFWANHNKDAPPKKDVVVDWLVNEGVSKKLAESMDTIMRTPNARKGGNKRVTPNTASN